MIYLNRFKSDNNGTFGTLIDGHGKQYCFTAEPPACSDHPCIPPNIYNVEPYQSPVHGDVWQIMNVPNRTNIEIHPGNAPIKDSLGCILVGNALGTVNGFPAVMNSQNTFAQLKNDLPQSFELTIRDTPL